MSRNDNIRAIIYNRNMFIIQATGLYGSFQLHSHYNKRLVDMTRSGLLILCSCDHLKHYNFLGSMDGNIYRKCKRCKDKSLAFKTACVCDLWDQVVQEVEKGGKAANI
jgi:hypothetical protein